MGRRSSLRAAADKTGFRQIGRCLWRHHEHSRAGRMAGALLDRVFCPKQMPKMNEAKLIACHECDLLQWEAPLSERMMIGWLRRVGIGVAALAFMIAAADARITHIEITKTEPAFGGQSFGDVKGVLDQLAARKSSGG